MHQTQMSEDMRPVGVQLPEDMLRELERVAEESGTSRSAAIRAALDLGLRARNYPEIGPLAPERQHMLTIAEQSAQSD